MQASTFTAVVVTGIALASAPGIARAQQNFPSKPIRVVVSTTAGSQPDMLARMIGQLAPAGTPRAIVNRINKEVGRILDLPDVRERTQSIGYVVEASTPEEYSKILRAQIQTLTKLVRDAGLRPK